MSWNDGYVTEIDYTRGYYRELSPVHQSFALASKGLRGPSAQDFKYLELGFGQGLSLNIHAAACRGEFWGTDFNPAQAASAQELASACGNGARLFDQSFAELAERRDLPEFDMIGLHGIYSWISPENRAAIVEVIRKSLKPGGVVYISYNCMPGWAAAGPLSHLLRLHASFAGNQASPVTKRVEEAFAFAGKLEEADALYFKANASIKDRVKRLAGMDKTYLAHEYLNEHWHPMQFDELAREMTPAKLTFGASASLLDHVDQLNISDKCREILGAVSNTVLRESLRDYMMNQQFRRDLWVRGPRQLSTSERSAVMRTMRFVLVRQATLEKLELRGALGTAKPDEASYGPLLEALTGAAKPISFAELELRLAPKGVSTAQLMQCLVVLTGAGYVAPAQDDATIQAVSKRCATLNKLLCRDFPGEGNLFLASPVLGAGVPAGAVTANLLQSCLSGRSKPDDLGADLWKALSGRGQRIMKDGKALETPQDNLREAVVQAQEFCKSQLPFYRRLGIV